MRRLCALLALTLGGAIVCLGLAKTVTAEPSSASYRLRGAHISAGGSSTSSASFSSTGTLGQTEPIGPSGSGLDLTTLLPGFPPIAAGDLPTLDLDGDGTAWYLDADDDGDGLDDVVETNSGVYGSPADTGTDSLVADSDGDGADDGTEVGAGSDPNNPFSLPGAVPVVSTAGRAAAALLLALSTAWALRSRLRTTG